MVSIEEVDDAPGSPSPSEERLLDAEEIEKLISQLERPTAKMQVESLVKKIRKDASALKAIEKTSGNDASTPVVTSPPPPKPVPTGISKPISTGAPLNTPSATYQTIDRFAFDAGTNKDKFVTLYIPLPGVGLIENKKEQITCDFGEDHFDVIVRDLNGKSYRLKKDKLEYDIVPEKSKYIVKADKIVVKLHKVKGEMGGGFSLWTKLTDPKWKDKKKKNIDPSAGLRDMITDMYNSGDEKMKQVIAESIMKNRNGGLGSAGVNQQGGSGGSD